MYRRKMLKNWSTFFPEFEPIADRLKTCFPDRWVRFHSLPGSKRYPENESECEKLLERHNMVLGHLTRPSVPVVLLSTEFSWSNAPSRPPIESSNATWWRSVQVGEASWHVYAHEIVWHPKTFDSIVLRVAKDEIANVMISDTECQWLVHPYDGGMDVVLSSKVARDLLKSEYSDWLSPRADGL